MEKEKALVGGHLPGYAWTIRYLIVKADQGLSSGKKRMKKIENITLHLFKAFKISSLQII